MGTKRLNDATDADQLALLRLRWRARLENRRCLIVGSAPNAVAPDPAGVDAIICINGSPWVARRLGLPQPDITVVAGYATRSNNEVQRATIAALRGLSTDELLFVEAGMSGQDGLPELDKVGFAYRHFRSITIDERAAIIEAVCGEPLGRGHRDDRISNGVFAIALAIWCGADEVALAGFSLAGGHAYIPNVTQRQHMRGDRRFLSRIGHFGCRVSTTSSDLSTAFGIALREGATPAGTAASC